MSASNCGDCITRASSAGVAGLLLQKVNTQEGSSAWATPRLPPAGYSFLIMDADGVIKRWDGSI